MIFLNILVLGNGFDLAHGLPTSYKDFLDYLSVIEFLCDEHNKHQSYPNEKEVVDHINETYPYMNKILKDGLIKQCNQTWIEKESVILSDIVSGKNLWYEYFRFKTYNKSMQNKREWNWIDFEAEISNVVRKLERMDISQNNDKNIPLTHLDIKGRDIFLIDFMGGKPIDFNQQRKDEFISHLERDLSNFISALGLYIQAVDDFSVNIRLPDIIGEKFNKVVSFNYTNTYRQLYCKNMSDEDIHFIHGRAGKHESDISSGLVLGANDTLQDKEKDENVCCLKFKKYFQRIYKKTGNKYKNFFKKDTKKENICSFFFGHSLSKTDGDIIRTIIYESDQVVIFYHNDRQHREEITNLVTILGKDTLIDFAENKIEFRQQKNVECIRD